MTRKLSDWIMSEYPTDGYEPWEKYLNSEILKELSY